MSAPKTWVPDSLPRLCYAGESIVDAVRIGGATVAVTTHRVLALVPDGEGPRLQEAALPNVTGVTPASAGNASHGWRAARYGLYGVLLLGASTVVNFNGIGTTTPPSGMGAGRVVSTAIALTGMLGYVDDALRMGGVLVLFVAFCFAGLYGYSRDRHLRVTVAGGDHLTVPADASASAVADRLGVALEKASKPSDG